MDAYLKLLDVGYFEARIALEGMVDGNVWRRPAVGLVSVGELAGHVAYSEAIRLAGEGEDLARCHVSSPLIDARFRYYPVSLAEPPSEQHRAMTTEQVCSELLRIHEESVAHLKALSPDMGAGIPGCPSGFTYGEFLEYAVFHVAYHTGQMYSVRHLLGDTTPDN